MKTLSPREGPSASMPSLGSRDALALYGEAGLMKSDAESAIVEGTLLASVSQSEL